VAVPRPPGFLIPLYHADLWGGETSRDALEAVVRTMDWRGVVEVVWGYLGASWPAGVEDSKHQGLILKNLAQLAPLYGDVLLRRYSLEPHRPALTREGMLAVLRVAVVSQAQPDATRAEFAGAFVRANLIANELLGAEILPSNPQNSAADLLPSELRSAVLHLDNPHDLLARAEAFIEWSKTPNAMASENALPIEADFRRFTGLDWREYAAATYVALSRCISVRDARYAGRLSALFDLDEWLVGLTDKRVMEQWFAVSSIPLVELRAEWAEATSLSFAASGSLWRRPVVQHDTGKFFVPYPQLIQNALGDGAFFLLLDGYAGADRLKFTRFYGEFFENYVAGCLTRGYAGRADGIVRPETEYVKGKQKIKSTDVVVAENGDVLFIEVMAKRPKLIESVLALKDDGIQSDVAAFVRKARELDKRIRDYRSGALFPDLPRPDGQRIFPVVVTPTEWPRVYLLHAVFPAAIAKEGLLAGCEPIELLDAGDVELLEGLLLQRGMRLPALLDRKNGAGGPTDARFKSVNDYLIFYEPSLLSENHRPGRERGGEIARSLLALGQSWFAA
jgi:hypothetical protein